MPGMLKGPMWIRRSEDRRGSELRDTVGHIIRQGHSWGCKVVSISTCSLDDLLNSRVSSKEKYVSHVFSDNFYFGQSLGIVFLTSFLFFPQFLKKFVEFPQGKSFRLFSSVMPDMTLITQSWVVMYQYKGRGKLVPFIPQHIPVSWN